ncbi:MAG: hypothetical protein ISP45_30785 [Reyranella sp.]|jgi:hypothetical protein|nr:hypothetical protein [Reyranella sp.]
MNPFESLFGMAQALPANASPCGCAQLGDSSAQFRLDFAYDGSGVGVANTVQRKFAFDLSKPVLTDDSLRVPLNDFAAIHDIVGRHTREALEMLHAVQRGDIDSAVVIARSIGLTEEELQKRGGGLAFLIVFVAAVVIILATPKGISVEADPPQPNPVLVVPKPAAQDANDYLDKK